jgi:putative protease
VELLAPAGSKDALKAAVIGGADAVYLGGKRFGARRLADNFTDAELQAAVRFAHRHDVKVYVAVNTLVKERELDDAYSYLRFLASIHADAVIIQDRGLLRVARERVALPLHASTQMGLHTPEGVAWAARHGVSRVILARELSLTDLAAIRRATGLELEVFIHGALCYAFSGQCLFSSILGGRSGNRGLCAQPCRKLYRHGSARGYLLSTADLFAVDLLPDLLRLGVDGVKIEGRMRSPLYVYLTSRIYSTAIRRAEAGSTTLITPRERELLAVVFNRGFTRGYLADRSVTQRRYQGNRGLPLGDASFDGTTLRVPTALLHPGDGVTLYRRDAKIGGFLVRDPTRVDDATLLVPPFPLRRGRYRVYKTRDRTFAVIRREIAATSFPFGTGRVRRTPLPLPVRRRRRTQADLSVYLSSLKALRGVLPYADRVYFEWTPRFAEAASLCDRAGVECVLTLPRLAFPTPDTDHAPLMIHTLGQYERYRDRTLYGHYALNVFNSRCIPALHQSTLSVELAKEDLQALTAHYAGRLEVLTFGKIELMVTRDTGLGDGWLVDPRGARFPVYRDRFDAARVLNSADLVLLDYLDELERMGIDSLGIDLRRRGVTLATTVAKAYAARDVTAKPSIRRLCGPITAGHYHRGVA